MTEQNSINYERSVRANEPQDSVLVLSSSHTVFPLFSRGCLIPAILEQNSGELPSSRIAGWLPAAVGSLPSNWVSELEESARNVIPIALELANGCRLAQLEVDGTAIPAVKFSDVRSVLFRTEEELRRFSSWSFEDVDIAALDIPLECRPDAFTAEPVDIEVGELTDSEAEGIKLRARFADMLMGLLAATVYISGSTRAEMDTLDRLLKFDFADGHTVDPDPTLFLAGILSGGSHSPVDGSVDGRLLSTTLQVIADLPTSSGWPAKEVLEQLRSGAIRHFDVASDEYRAIEDWADRCRKVLSSTAQPPLSDDGSLVRRALLLLLMREDPRSLSGSSDITETVPIGKRVRRLAFQLAGARSGLRSLPTDIKFAEVTSPRVLLNNASIWFTSLLSGSWPEGLPDTDIRYDPTSGYAGDWRVLLDSQPLWTKSVRIPAGLRKVAEDCRYYGYEVDVLTPYSIVVKGGRDTEVSLEVEISILSYRPQEDKIRFTSRVSPTGRGRKRGTKRATYLKKNELLDLLRMNSYEDSHGRIAVDAETSEIIVIVDQLIDTMDRDECVSHLRNVSRLAAQLA